MRNKLAFIAAAVAVALVLVGIGAAGCRKGDPLPAPAASGGPHRTAGEDPERLVFILAGQSNMVGRGRPENLPADDRGLPPGVELYPDKELSPNEPRKGFGPELGFAQAMADARPSAKLTLIKHAMGGSSLFAWSPRWTADQARVTRNERHGPLYHGLMKAVETVSAPPPAAILWMQGERDAKFEPAARAYGANLEELVLSLRRDLEAPEALFLLGEIDPPPERYEFAAEVRAAQRAAAARLPGVRLVSTDGLSKETDGVHYDSAGLVELGRRFAAAYLASPLAAADPSGEAGASGPVGE